MATQIQIPTRLLVCQRFDALLSNLTVKGAPLDLTGKIIRGRSVIGDETRPPALSILESPRPDFATYAGEDWSWRKDKLMLLIQGRAEDDKLNPGDEAYWLEAAVEEKLYRVVATKPNGNPLYPDDYMLGGLITGLEVAPPVVRPPEDKTSASAFFFLVLRVGIAVEIGKPYTEVP